MDNGGNDQRPDIVSSGPARSGLAGRWIVVTVLLLLLVATAVLAYLGWTSAGNIEVPTSAYVAMAFGVIFSVVVGVGLMTLVFYSSRKGYDEPAVLVEDKDSDPDDTQNT